MRKLHAQHLRHAAAGIARMDPAREIHYPDTMNAILIYLAAAMAEIGGCFAFWAWWRLDRSLLWLLPGIASLALFAWLLALSPAGFAGRAFAAYGGVYIASSLLWLWAVEGQRPDQWDLAGAAICIAGAALILWAPRGA